MNILKKNENIDSEHDYAYYVTNNSIEDMLLSETYDRNGQLIDAADAGESLLLLTSAAADAANKAYNEFHSHSDEEALYERGDVIYAYDNSLEFYCVEDNTKEDVDFSRSGDTVKGFNYWNGNRWCSIIVERGDIEPEFTVENEEEIKEAVKNAVKNKNFVEERRGVKYYEYKNMRIEESAWVSDFEIYKVYID